MWCLRCEELLAGFGCKRRIVERQDDVANRDLSNTLVLLQLRRQIVHLNMSGAVPWSEESVFSEVSVATMSVVFNMGTVIATGPIPGPSYSPIIGQVHLGAKAYELSIKNDGATVESAAPMHDRKAHVDENAMERGIRQDLEQHIHGMVIDIRLEIVVKTAIG